MRYFLGSVGIYTLFTTCIQGGSFIKYNCTVLICTAQSVASKHELLALHMTTGEKVSVEGSASTCQALRIARQLYQQPKILPDKLLVFHHWQPVDFWKQKFLNTIAFNFMPLKLLCLKGTSFPSDHMFRDASLE